jgi:hypothetical protein
MPQGPRAEATSQGRKVYFGLLSTVDQQGKHDNSAVKRTCKPMKDLVKAMARVKKIACVMKVIINNGRFPAVETVCPSCMTKAPWSSNAIVRTDFWDDLAPQETEEAVR